MNSNNQEDIVNSSNKEIITEKLLESLLEKIEKKANFKEPEYKVYTAENDNDRLKRIKSFYKDEGIEVNLIRALDDEEAATMIEFSKNGKTETIEVNKIIQNETDNYDRWCYDLKNVMLKLDFNISPETVEFIQSTLGEFISDFKDYKYYYNNIGWTEINNNICFKYDKLIGTSCRGELQSKWTSAITESDVDEEVYYYQMAELCYRIKKPVVNIVLSAALSGVVRQLLDFTKETNINLNIHGESGTGKSTLTNLALSLFGQPELLESSFNDTENAIEQIRYERNVMPYIIDDRALSMIDIPDNKRATEILKLIFREYEGRVKSRANNIIEDGIIYGAIISSTVESLFDQIRDNDKTKIDYGQYRRLIELTVKKEDIFNDKELANAVQKLAINYNGIFIHDFVITILEITSLTDEISVIKNDNISKIVDKLDDTIKIDEISIENCKESIRNVYNECLKYVDTYIDENITDKDTNTSIKYLSQRYALIILTARIMDITISKNTGANRNRKEHIDIDCMLESLVENANNVLSINKENDADILSDNNLSNNEIIENLDYMYKVINDNYDLLANKDKPGEEYFNKNRLSIIGKNSEKNGDINIVCENSLILKKLLANKDYDIADIYKLNSSIADKQFKEIIKKNYIEKKSNQTNKFGKRVDSYIIRNRAK